MKKISILILMSVCLIASAQKKENSGYPISPVPFTSVKITDTFWGQRIEANRKVTLSLAFSKCEETGRYENFVRAAHPSDTTIVKGFSFDDTDVYKTIEGASYSMQTYPNPKLEKYIDSVLTIVAAAQEADGYLYTSRTMNPAHPHEWAGSERWEKVEDLSHELYNLGHMIEGAIAYYQATGKKNFLNIAEKYADCAVRELGKDSGHKPVVPGHQIIEMAMAKLYVLTGEKKYLDFAKYLLDERGRTDMRSEYNQSHKPVVEQDEAVGHAVRAAYMYTGMADVAALTGDTSYINAIDRIWDNIVSKKLYITGGIGATGHGEAFGKNYELPNMSAYCETCAAIGNVYLNYRLFLLHGESKYFDVLERTLYNGLISGVSLDGGGFFYPNPLESMGQHQRQAWFGCACCPSNICRFIPSVPGYVYAVHNNDLYVNLFMSNNSEIKMDNNTVKLTQTTQYPWNGDIKMTVSPKKSKNFNMKIRVPGWVLGDVVPSDLYTFTDKKRLSYSISVNGKEVESELTNGYLTINRKWKKGDKIDIHFDMEVRTVKANPHVEVDKGKISIERGPVVYCAEWPDNDFSVLSAIIPQKPKFEVEEKSDMLCGIDIINTDAQLLSYNKEGKIEVKNVDLELIPYYAWAHRGSGEMAVWMANDISASRPLQQPTIASESKVDASHKTKALSAINDLLIPKDGNDRTVPYYHWWPKKATTEWISYAFEEETTVSNSTVYWYDDGPWGGCRIPESWKIYYQDADGKWNLVKNLSSFEVKKGVPSEISFTPVKTKAIKLEVKLDKDYASGIFEWIVE